jgi:hypothetical protein
VSFGRLIDSGTWRFPNFLKLIKFIAMHHCKKIIIAVQDLFAATQQKDQKPLFLIKNRGLGI